MKIKVLYFKSDQGRSAASTLKYGVCCILKMLNLNCLRDDIGRHPGFRSQFLKAYQFDSDRRHSRKDDSNVMLTAKQSLYPFLTQTIIYETFSF